MSTNFARLEVHNGLQVLARVQSHENDRGDSGPCVFIRCDPDFTVEMTYGPWPDDDEGWDLAEQFMNEADLAAYAENALGFLTFGEDE